MRKEKKIKSEFKINLIHNRRRISKMLGTCNEGGRRNNSKDGIRNKPIRKSRRKKDQEKPVEVKLEPQLRNEM